MTDLTEEEATNLIYVLAFEMRSAIAWIEEADGEPMVAVAHMKSVLADHKLDAASLIPERT